MAALRTLSLWLALAGFGLIMASPHLPPHAIVPGALVLMAGLRCCARREGRREALAQAYSLGDVVARSFPRGPR